MTSPAIENLTSAKLMLFMGQLPDWHLDAVTTHAVRALRSQAAGEILSAMPMPALPRPPLPNTTALIALMEAHLASRWVAIGSKKIPYDRSRNRSRIIVDDSPIDFNSL